MNFGEMEIEIGLCVSYCGSKPLKLKQISTIVVVVKILLTDLLYLILVIN